MNFWELNKEICSYTTYSKYRSLRIAKLGFDITLVMMFLLQEKKWDLDLGNKNIFLYSCLGV